MRLFVSLFGSLRSYGLQGQRPFELELERGAAVKDVLDILSIPEREARVTLINGRPATDETILNPEDQLIFLSPLEGG